MASLWARFVRFGFRLLYNEMAFTYDWVSWFVSLGQWRGWQLSALDHVSLTTDSLVLELAHGTGILQQTLARRNIPTVGYDLSPQMGQITSGRLKKIKQPIRLVRGDTRQLPFPDQAFDCILCTFPTADFLSDTTLAEISRVLKSGNQAIIVYGAKLTGQSFLHRIIDWLFRITGQRYEESTFAKDREIERNYSRYGLQTRVVHTTLSASCVDTLILEKS